MNTKNEQEIDWLDENLLRSAGYDDYEIKQMQECNELDNIEEENDDED